MFVLVPSFADCFATKKKKKKVPTFNTYFYGQSTVCGIQIRCEYFHFFCAFFLRFFYKNQRIVFVFIFGIFKFEMVKNATEKINCRVIVAQVGRSDVIFLTAKKKKKKYFSSSITTHRQQTEKIMTKTNVSITCL